ncbi:hypothetical protein NKH18_13250 [Streptomyces sp. M10(2022)]
MLALHDRAATPTAAPPTSYQPWAGIFLRAAAGFTRLVSGEGQELVATPGDRGYLLRVTETARFLASAVRCSAGLLRFPEGVWPLGREGVSSLEKIAGRRAELDELAESLAKEFAEVGSSERRVPFRYPQPPVFF